jgi:AIR synthase-related protein
LIIARRSGSLETVSDVERIRSIYNRLVLCSMQSMNDDEATLVRIVSFLAASSSVQEKLTIRTAYEPAQKLAGATRLGDDCAAIRDGDSWLLFAAEGMLPSFLADDPWFAGYSAVMVNLSDVAAMGGRPLAVVDILWSPGLDKSEAIWEGMKTASKAYGVPIVGGHTTTTKSGPAFLAAAVLGKTKHLITSFDAQAGDDLLVAVDLRGDWRGEKPFWNASVGIPAERLRADLDLLPMLAQNGWCHAGKDISNGGIVGTLTMLLDCSSAGAELWVDRLPRPLDVDLNRWLIAFPSFGFLLSVAPGNSERVITQFRARGVACAIVGKITSTRSLILGYGAARAPFP